MVCSKLLKFEIYYKGNFASVTMPFFLSFRVEHEDEATDSQKQD